MDVLDLSLNEKKSRRKTHAPQRHHRLIPNAGSAEAETYSPVEADESELPGDDHSTKSGLVELRRGGSFDLNDNESFVKTRNFSNNNNSNDLESRSLILSPYSSPGEATEDKESIDQEITSDRTASPKTSRSDSPDIIIPQQSVMQFQSNTNINNNSNNNNSVTLNRFPQLVVDAAGNRENDSIPDLSPFHERFVNLNSTLPQTVIRPNIKPSSSHPFSSYDVQPVDTPGIPERTKKQNRWAFNVWREWARKRNISAGPSTGNLGKVPMDVGKATEVELDFWLAKFVQEIRRKDGNPYPPHTLMQIVMGIQRYLRQQAGRPSICILDRSNPVYGRFRSVLDSRIKELTSEGVTSAHKNNRRSALATAASSSGHSTGQGSSYNSSSANYPEEAVLWNAGVIGDDTALGLLNAVFYHNTVTFGIRNIDDHWNLKTAHFVVGNRGQQSQTYIEFVPSRDPIYVTRGLTKDCRVYADPGNPRCVVKLFLKYMSLVPSDGPFYRHPQETTLVDKSIRFSDQWVGKNRLRAMIKHVFDSTRLDGREKVQSVAIQPTTNHVNSSRYGLPQPTPAGNDTNLTNKSVYDRIAQLMMQFNYMRSSPQIAAIANSRVSPINPTTPSPKPESTGYTTPPLPLPQTRLLPRSNEIVLKRESSPDSVSEGTPNPKKRKCSQQDNVIESKYNTKEEIDDVTVTSSCGKHVDENTLEVAVPPSIETVVVIKGSKRFSIQLE